MSRHGITMTVNVSGLTPTCVCSVTKPGSLSYVNVPALKSQLPIEVCRKGVNGNNPTHTFEGGRPSFTDSYNKKTSRQELSAAKMHYRKRRRKKKKREKNVKKRDAAIVSRRNPNTVRYSTVLVSQHTFCRLLKPLVPNH